MDPQSEPYRPSWLPFGPSRRSEMTTGLSGVRTRAVGRSRIPMAPVQLGRAAMDRAPVAVIPVAFDLPPAEPTMRARPPQAPTTQVRPSALPPLGPPRRPRQTAARRPAAPAPARYAQPQVAPSSGPGQAYPQPAFSPSTRQPLAYAPPGVPRPRRRQRVDRSRVPLPAIAASATVASSADGGPAPARRAFFDPMAVVAIILTPFLAPVALALALASLRRSYTTGSAPALSWLAVLVAVVGTLITFGILSSIVTAFQGLG